MSNGKLFKVFYLIILIIASNIVEAQNKETYIIELKKNLKLEEFKLANDYLDIHKLVESKKNKSYSEITELAEFIEVVKPNKVRKLIRRLPENLTYLQTNSGLKYNIEKFQRLLVIETNSKIDENFLTKKIINNKIIKKIILDPKIELSNWPPNDLRYSEQKQFYLTNYNIDLPRAWKYSAGNSGIKIAVIDHGIDYTHPDLGGGFGYGFRIRGGWDFADNDSDPRPVYSTERHGTPIAGIIGALNWNNKGVIGIAGGSSSSVTSGCQIFSFRVTSGKIGSNGQNQLQSALIAEAVLEAATDPSVNNGFGYGVNVINCSFGSLAGKFWDWNSLFYRSYYGSFAWAYLNDVVVSVARGNIGGEVNATTIMYPADFSNGHAVLSISGVTDNGNLSYGSCYGNGVSIVAPYYIDLTTTNNNKYDSFSGTSNSTPFVAAVSALIFSKFRTRGINLDGEDVQQILKISAEPTNEPNKYGAGRLNAGQALHISSSPFNLIHTKAKINKTITTVSNPPNNKLALYYPYSINAIAQTKKITASVQIPNDFLLDSTWVWANNKTKGLEWSNPSYGMPMATKVSQNGRIVKFETFVYRMVPIGGNTLSWYPTTPSDAEIEVTILGKKLPPPPYSVSISGPSYLRPRQSGTWRANVSGGRTPYTYRWQYKNFCNDDIRSTNGTRDIPCNVWFNIGGNSNSITRYGNRSFQLKVTVTDANNNSKTVYKTVSVGDDLLRKNSSDDYLTEMEVPKETKLSTNYPNPFNPSTTIKYQLSEPGFVSLRVYDMLGREVAALVNEQKGVGFYETKFDASKLTSGIYFYTIRVNNYSASKKMLLTK